MDRRSVAQPPTIGVSMILGGNAFKEEGAGHSDLSNCLESLRPIAAEQIVIVDTGINTEAHRVISDESAFRKKNELPSIEVHSFKWIDHFAAARNESLRHITTDFMVWIDGDDTLRGADVLKPLMAEIDQEPDFIGAWLPYEYARDDHGNVTTLHTRERLVRMSVGWHWEHRIHEALIPHGPGVWFRDSRVVWQHQRPLVTQSERNLRLLFMEYAENPIPRTVQGIAHQYFVNEEWEKAAEWYEKFYLDMRAFEPERWQAICYAARAHTQMGDYTASIRESQMAIYMHPEWQDGYLQLARAYSLDQDHDKAIHWARYAKTITQAPWETLMRNRVEELVEPSAILSASYAMVGEYDKALEETDEVLALLPDHKGMQENREWFVKAQRDVAVRDGFLSLAGTLPDQDVIRLHKQTLRYSKLQKEPAIRDVVIPAIMRQARLGTQQEISIYCGPTLDDWTPESINTTGIGGSETAVVEIAKRLAQDGFRVWVYNQCGLDEGMHDGVGYIDYRRWRPSEKADIHISWRMPYEGLGDIAAGRKWLWMHDLNKGEIVNEKNTQQYERVLGVSQYHADYLAKVYPFLDGRLGYLPNGANLERFSLQGVERQPFKVSWTSSPDRGLLHLLNIWPEVVATEPGAELHIFYGWNNIDKMIASGNLGLAEYKAVCERIVDQFPSIHWRGRVGQDELARELMSSQVWAYPTGFIETFCIGAVEAMAADCFIVTSKLGNIPNIVGDTGYLVQGAPTTPLYRRKFEGVLMAGLMDTEIKYGKRGQGPERAREFTWDKAYEAWKALL